MLIHRAMKHQPSRTPLSVESPATSGSDSPGRAGIPISLSRKSRLGVFHSFPVIPGYVAFVSRAVMGLLGRFNAVSWGVSWIVSLGAGALPRNPF